MSNKLSYYGELDTSAKTTRYTKTTRILNRMMKALFAFVFLKNILAYGDKILTRVRVIKEPKYYNF